MKHMLITADNRSVQVACIGCAIAKQQLEVVGGIIATSRHFLVSQDLENPIPGFLIISSKRHMKSIADFSKRESEDFASFLLKTRKALRRVLPRVLITLIQEEGTKDSHFHLWLFPWYPWMSAIGKNIRAIPRIMRHAKSHNRTRQGNARVIAVSQKIHAVMSRE